MENMPKIYFRDATREDMDRMSIIEEECFSDAWSKDSLLSCYLSPFYDVVVVETDNTVVAYGIIKCMYEDGELVRIAVSNEYRSKKIGYNLLDWLIKIASHEGVDNVFLDVRESNDIAIALYEKMGFVIYDKTKDFYSKPVESSIKMKKDLRN